jgi:hypothetical protein
MELLKTNRDTAQKQKTENGFQPVRTDFSVIILDSMSYKEY